MDNIGYEITDHIINSVFKVPPKTFYIKDESVGIFQLKITISRQIMVIKEKGDVFTEKLILREWE